MSVSYGYELYVDIDDGTIIKTKIYNLCSSAFIYRGKDRTEYIEALYYIGWVSLSLLISFRKKLGLLNIY